MARFRLEIEYEGTRYSGWQIQKNARTIQGELQAAAERVFGTRAVETQGAGRTDAGVHALAQTAHLQAATSLAPPMIRTRLNDALPADIHVLRVRPAPDTFHARHDALSRTYLYQISRRRTAFGKRFVWWIKDRLEVRRMQEACGLLTGLHDFRSFTADDPTRKDPRVEVQDLTVVEAEDLILIRITASHFLWKMVRQVVGVLAEVGRGTMRPADVEPLLRAKSGRPAELTAPPSGLFMERARYAGDKIPSGGPAPLLRITRPI